MSDEADDKKVPGSSSPWKVERLFAFIAVDPDGDEGIIAASTPLGLTQAVGGDLDRIDQLRPVAQAAANHLGQPVYLRIFESMREIETLYPDLPTQGDKPS